MDIVIRRQSEQIYSGNDRTGGNILHDKKFEWGFLRKQCHNLELETFYNFYMQRLQRSYLSIFIVMQTLLGITHSIMLLIVAKDKTAIFPEIFSYITAILLVWISLFITFREEYIKRRQWIAYVASFFAISTLVLADLIVPLYHAATDFPRPPLRPAYGSYILFAVYIFIPLSENWHAFFLGIAVTLCYIAEFAMVTYRLDSNLLIKTASEAVFLLCVNFFGNYFRLMKEVAIRTTFLDRRECVEENLLLRYAREQVRSLLLSILPAHTADNLERDIREMISKIKQEKMTRNHSQLNDSTSTVSLTAKRWRSQPTTKLYVEEYKDVSILYADVVNFTYLTTQLDVKPLVETLHELFVKFDQASEEYNVLRIKFLGDCYYCVAGVPEKNDHHAKSCVVLGLRMIRDMREVKIRRKLNIDMRIGVHSGNIISGVIGACKWQYDIWSKDVDIANRLEATGEAGRVHVTLQTLELLDGAYNYEEGTEKAKNDEILKLYKIQTFLIKPHFYMDHRYFSMEDGHRASLGVRRALEITRKSKPSELSIHKNFMQNTIEQYNQIRTQTKFEMSRELDKMPIGKFHLSKFCLETNKRLTQDELEERNFRSNVSTFFLFFKDNQWELLFLMEPDVMLKYSCLIGLGTFLGIFTVQAINNPRGIIFWIVNGVACLILLCFIPITWYKRLWIILHPPKEQHANERRTPKRYISKLFYRISHHVTRSIIGRTIIYLMVVTVLCASSLLHLLECKKYNEDLIVGNETVIDYETNSHRLCFNTWAITESLVLALCMSFLFVRIPFLFKFFIGILIVFAYAWIVFGQFSFAYNNSPTTNLGLDPEYAHIYQIIVTFIIFHMVDRQTEFIAKVDYNWQRQLLRKKEDAAFTNDTVKVLVQNILPAHVAEIYMSRKMKDELYYEKYDNVAIMFATIKNYDMEKVGLNVLNRIICDFDEILMSYSGPFKIEKIKLAGWTYMAACGLDPGRCDSTISLTGLRNNSGHRSSTVLNAGRRSFTDTLSPKRLSLDSSHQHIPTPGINVERKISSRQSHNVVYLMTEFALELMKSLDSFNHENFQNEITSENDQQNGMLRIGISHGEIMAGVVGSCKPLYDVWGNPVNMASRMDSTGIPGKIQVTKETAEVLKSFGIECEYRGLTYVKGLDYIPTYFASFDENFQFIKCSGSISDNLNSFSSDGAIYTKL